MAGIRVEAKSVFEDGIQRVGGQSELRPVQNTRQQKPNSEIILICLHRCDNEGVQGDLIHEPVVAGNSEQVLAKLLRNSITEHAVT